MSAALERIRAALAPELHPKRRRGMLRNVRNDLDLELRRWSHWAPAWLVRFSMYGVGAVIISRRVLDASREADWNDDTTETGEIDLLASLIHELVHAARAEARGPLLWRLLYLLWPPFRRAEELEADAHGIALRVVMLRVRPSSAYTHHLAKGNAEQWTGWRSPYFCGGDLNAYTLALLRRVVVLLEGWRGALPVAR